MKLPRALILGACLSSGVTGTHAKPIAFANGTTAMAEYGAGTMTEAQIFHAPRYFWSLGAGYTRFDSDRIDRRREITYARANYLVKRWNLESAQANVFAWAGAGSAYSSDTNDHRLTWNAGGQADYETRRVYFSVKTDLFRSAAFSHRVDTVQAGIAPYEHDTDSLAAWFVVQARRYTEQVHDGVELALLLRLFRKNAWVEAGATTDGKLQAMVMVNF